MRIRIVVVLLSVANWTRQAHAINVTKFWMNTIPTVATFRTDMFHFLCLHPQC